MPEDYSHISVRDCDGVLVLTIRQTRLTQYETARAMADEMTDAVAAAQAANVVVDLQNLEFMSSVGYLPFLRVARRVRDAGGRLLLSNLSEVVAEMFVATQLLIEPSSAASPFQAARTLEDAIAMFSKGG